jgi:hypothetical protein
MRRGNMAKLNVWFARGFSTRVKSVKLPAEAVDLDEGEDMKGSAVQKYFKKDVLRFEAWMAGACLAHYLFSLGTATDDDPDHEKIKVIERKVWVDARERPKGYPIVLAASLLAFPAINLQDYDVAAPLVEDSE